MIMDKYKALTHLSKSLIACNVYISEVKVEDVNSRVKSPRVEI